jgi:hypothetical protein
VPLRGTSVCNSSFFSASYCISNKGEPVDFSQGDSLGTHQDLDYIDCVTLGRPQPLCATAK